MRPSITRISKGVWLETLGVGLIILGWTILSGIYNSAIMPSPLETITALINLTMSGELAANVQITLQRILISLVLAVIIGMITGSLAGLSSSLERIIRPLIIVLMAVPAVVFVVMAMVWFGMGSKMSIFLATLLVFPVMHVNIAEGLRAIDPKLLEMARIFRFSSRVMITKVYLPGLVNPFLAAFSLCTSSAVRLTILAELLGAGEGIGHAIGISRSYLETDHLFAWILVLLAMLFILERISLKIARTSSRWQGSSLRL